MDRMFERTFGRDFGGELDTLKPALDISESDKEVAITAELPGVDLKDVDVSVSGNMLTIAGEKKEEHEEKEAGYQRQERRYGFFRRSISLPKGVDPDSITAEYSKGVLTVRLNKSQEYLPKKVPVKALEQQPQQHKKSGNR